MNFFKLENGQLISGSGSKLPDDSYITNWEVLATKEDGSYYSFYNADGTADLVKEQEELDLKTQAEFRALRDSYLAKCDIAINKALDNGVDATELRALRQALRDATIEWIMPNVAIIN